MIQIHYAGLVGLYLNDPLLRVWYSVVGLGRQLSHHQVKVSRPCTKRLYVYLVMPVSHVYGVATCHTHHTGLPPVVV